MSRVLAIGFGPAPGAGPSSAHAALDLLAAERWRPTDAGLDILVLPWMWWPPGDPYAQAAHFDAVLIFTACETPDRARVLTRALNRVDPTLRDVAGYGWAGSVIAPGGPGVRDATVSAQALARAIGFAGVECGVGAPTGKRSDLGVANRALFGVLETQPHAVLVELPPSIESARAVGRAARYNRYELVRGVQAAIGYAAATTTVTLPGA